MYYIYKTISNDKIEVGIDIKITDDIDVIWSGLNLDQFKFETGLTENDIKGIRKLDNKTLIFDSVEYEKQRAKDLPIAMGKDLLVFVMDLFQDSPTLERIQMHGYFNGTGLMSFLTSPNCNPLPEEDFLVVLDLFAKSSITKSRKDKVLGHSTEWINYVRFIK